MSISVREFARSGHPKTLFSAFLYFDISFMVWVMLGPLAVFIAEQYKLSPSEKGLLVAFPLLTGSLLRLVLGPMADRIGGKKTALIGLTVTVLPLLWGWLGAKSLNELYFVGLLLGVAGASFAVALPMASRWYPPQHQGLAMGIAGAGNSGTVLAALFAPRLAKFFGDWHTVFALAMIPVALTWIIVALLAKDSLHQSAPKKLDEYLSVLKEPETLWFCLFYAVTFGGFVGLASFLPTFFKDQYHLDKVQAGNFTALCVFAGSFIRPIGGYLADRFGGIRMLVALYALIAAMIFVIAQLPPLGITTLLLFLLMATLGCGNGSVFQLVPQRFPQQIGVVTGIVGAAGGVGGFFLPSLLGYIKQLSGSFGIGFLFLALGSVVCVALVLALRSAWIQSGWLAEGGRAVTAPMVIQVKSQ